MKKVILPSEKAEQKAEDKNRRQLDEKAKAEQLRRDMAMTFKTAHGLRVLDWLMKECQFGEPILGVNPATQEICADRTLYQAMRLNLYIKIRKMLPFNILKEVEYHE